MITVGSVPALAASTSRQACQGRVTGGPEAPSGVSWVACGKTSSLPPWGWPSWPTSCMPWSARTGSEERPVNSVVTTGAAVLALAALLALVHVPLGTWINRVFTDDRGLAPGAPGLPHRRGRPPHRAALDRLRPLRGRLRRRLGPRAVPAPGGAGLVALGARPLDGLAHRAQHGRLVHHRTRTGSRMPERPAPATPCRPSGWPRRTSSPLHGPGRSDRAGPRPRPAQHRPDRQLLGRPGAGHQRESCCPWPSSRRSCSWAAG